MSIKSIIESLTEGQESSDAKSTGPCALGYVRVSTEHQEEKGLSLPAQRTAIEEYAKKNGIKLLEIYEEAKSGFQDEHKRIEFHKMIERAKSENCVSMVIVHDSSRFCRDAYRAPQLRGDLLQYGVQVVSVTEPSYDPETVSGLWMQKVTEAKNATYSLEVAFHTRKGMKENIQRRDPDTGYCFQNGGQPIFGYKAKRISIGVQRNGEQIYKTIWVLNDEVVNGKPMYEWAREMLMMAANGASLDSTRDFLNNNGVPAPRSCYWGTSTIHSLLELNCLMQYGGCAVWNVRGKKQRRNPVEDWEIVEGGMPAIISEETVGQIYKIRKRFAGLGFSEHNSAVRSDSSRYLLSGGLFKCQRCGANIIGFTGGNSKHYKKLYYKCGTAQYHRGLGCGKARHIGKEEIEDAIIDAIGRRFEEWADFELFEKRVEEHIRQSKGNSVSERASINKQIEEVKRKRENIRHSIEDGFDDIGWANSQLHELNEKEAELKAKLEKQPEEEVEMRLDTAGIKEAFNRFGEVMANGTNAEKRKIIRSFVSHMQIEPESGSIKVLLSGLPAHFVIPLGAGTLSAVIYNAAAAWLIRRWRLSKNGRRALEL